MKSTFQPEALQHTTNSKQAALDQNMQPVMFR